MTQPCRSAPAEQKARAGEAKLEKGVIYATGQSENTIRDLQSINSNTYLAKETAVRIYKISLDVSLSVCRSRKTNRRSN